jgi:hypothetical protein
MRARLLLTGLIVMAVLSGAAALAQQPTSKVYTLPPPIIGQGNITASSTSTAINAAITLAPNSGAFPVGTLINPLFVKVPASAAAGITICWQGGLCTAAKGEYISPSEQGQWRSLGTQNMTTNPPTFLSTGTPTVTLEW